MLRSVKWPVPSLANRISGPVGDAAITSRSPSPSKSPRSSQHPRGNGVTATLTSSWNVVPPRFRNSTMGRADQFPPDTMTSGSRSPSTSPATVE
jgi:hypothetical protein